VEPSQDDQAVVTLGDETPVTNADNETDNLQRKWEE
jgi:hypothetical protein